MSYEKYNSGSGRTVLISFKKLLNQKKAEKCKNEAGKPETERGFHQQAGHI